MDQFFDFFSVAANNVWIYGGTFLLVLSVLVFIHEWGHYIVARMCGVGIEVFSIGFGRELFGYTDKSGTRWKLALVPLGGYVKMFGDADPASAGKTDEIALHDGTTRKFTEEDKKKAFFAKPVWQRSLIVFAGPAINFLFAIVILAVLFASYGRPVAPPLAVGVKVGSAAEQAGFQPGDRLISEGGNSLESFEDIRRYVTIALDTPTDYLVHRDGQEIIVKAAAKRIEETDRFGFTHERGQLGLLGPGNGFEYKVIDAVDGQATAGDPEKARRLVAERFDRTFIITLKPLVEGGDVESYRVRPTREANANPKYAERFLILTDQREEVIPHTPITALGSAISETRDVVGDTLTALGQMVMGTRSPTELGGVIRIGAVAGDMATKGLIALLTFTALLSINLGLINLFPVPMLDGGHLVFYAVEALKGSPISEQIQEYAFRVGFALLIALMVFANLNDVVQLLS